MWSRREFVGSVCSGILGGAMSNFASSQDGAPRKKLAIITTVLRPRSHGQHMGDRFLVGYPIAGRWVQPRVQAVSLYVDQKPEGDLSRQRADEFHLRLSDSISDALCLGGQTLAVDAVLIIGEHGDYPDNEYGQKKYPRYEFFQKVVEVFRRSKRCVPVFNDKHLSWNWNWAKEMVDTSRALGFPLMAGSSLPVTWRLPAVEMPLNADVREVMCVAPGGLDSYDFHALEVIQCMVERRRGGETGVASVESLGGDAFWKAFAAGSWDQGGWSAELFAACMARSQQLTQAQANRGFNHRYPTVDEMHRLVGKPTAFRIQYRDGLKATMLLMSGLIGDFTLAAKLADADKPLSTLFHLPPGPNVQYSAELMSRVEDMFLTGQAPTPIDRTLLTSGILASAMQSLTLGKRVDTPHLSVTYAAPRQSGSASFGE